MNKGFFIVFSGFLLSLSAGLFLLEQSDSEGITAPSVTSGPSGSTLTKEPDGSVRNPKAVSSNPKSVKPKPARKNHQPIPGWFKRTKSKESHFADDSSFLPAGSILDLHLSGPILKRVEGLEGAERPRIGKLQAYDQRGFFFVSRAGKMLYVPVNVKKVSSPTAEPFVRFDSQEMMAFMSGQFGNKFRIIRSRFFVLAVSKKISKIKARDWGKKMDRFYQSLESYFRIRGIVLRKPKNVLVAMVFPSKKEMRRYADSVSDKVSNGFVAYYSSLTNRVALYDSPNIHLDKETIFHEATYYVQSFL